VLEDWLDGTPVPAEARQRFVEVLRSNVRFPSELRDWAERIYGQLPPPDESGHEILIAAGAEFFETAIRLLDENGALSPQRLRQATGVRGRSLFLPLRLAVTGQPHGPELPELLALMSPQRLRERLRQAGELARAR
jgi:glutamyl-tRNA synthetase